jgi:alpha-beta hydrolase superfamily lysophospholipase
VAALDMRGHGDSGPRGHAAYVGQLEDDIEDFMRAVPHNGPSTLAGFSSGGGFVLRFAGGTRQDLFDRYVLLAPFLHHTHPPTGPTTAAGCRWACRASWPLTLLNAVGITTWNHLPVLRFGLNDVARQHLTSSYDFNLATAFARATTTRPTSATQSAHAPVVAGRDDELFDATKYAAVFEPPAAPCP